MSTKKTKRDIDKEKMFNKIMPSAAASRDEDADAPRPLYPRPPIVDTLSDGSNPDFKPVATPPQTSATPSVTPSATQTVTPNTAMPNAVTPNTVTPNTVTPNAVTPNTVTPNTVTPNTVTPNTVTPNTVTPNAAMPNAAMPNATMPNAVMPNAAMPNAVTPNATMPNVTPNATQTVMPNANPTIKPAPTIPDIMPADIEESEHSQEVERKIEEIIPELPEPQTPHFAQQYQQTASFAELFASKTGQHIEPHGEIHEDTHSENVTVADVAPTTAENAKETVLINIKERMVMKKLEKSLEKFNCCKCYFCRQDVVAAALNLLPPKYVVVVREDIDALIKKENDQDVTAALIKAILQVRGNPRH